ncbi:MAG: hypothetical protein BIFFINMI_01973 [Phycisphaerae bacterium]|nr:hypothetical protein [Phycisphaerae bacterium]
MNRTPYGFRIMGDCAGRRHLIDFATAYAAYARCDALAEVNRESYLSAFTFGQDFRQHLERTGTTKGFAGLCSAPVIWWDIDRADDLPRAQADARRLAASLVDRYGLPADSLLLFFSGAKGFHVGLPCSPWNPAPTTDFHRIARRFCETLAAEVGAEIDTAIYDRVRAFRAPNSRHPKAGLYKRLVSLAELQRLDIAAILAQATQPAPFDVPLPTADDAYTARMVEDWTKATDEARVQSGAGAARQVGPTPAPSTLNRRTLDFIRNGATNGERHKRLFSAAANLAELGCPANLAYELLTEAGRDSGLSPSEVRRVIDCGLRHKEHAT